MYGIEQEIQGLQNALELIIRKKNYLLEALAIAFDPEATFALRTRVDNLEREIDAYRQKLDVLSAKAPENQEVGKLQQEAEGLKQIIIQNAEKIYNIGHIDKADFH